jgi:hypothetical protein
LQNNRLMRNKYNGIKQVGKLKKFFKTASLAVGFLAIASAANSADLLLDPTPVAQQPAPVQPATAVDAVNFEVSLLGGAYQRNVLGTASNFMFTGSVATPIPGFANFGAQLDGAIGVYDGDFTSAAGGLHIFYRNEQGLIGIYGDWAYTDPEHGGRVGVELSSYHDRWSVDALVGIQFGQHFESEFIDEVDLSYYYTDNLRVSVGHRLTSRGHVGNLSFEHLLNEQGFDGFSVFGEIEAGEDNYVGGFGGIRYAFGGNGTTLIERDRRSNVQVRIPRNLSSVTQCGNLDVPRPETSLRAEQTNLCASEDEINALSSPAIGGGISKL